MIERMFAYPPIRHHSGAPDYRHRDAPSVASRVQQARTAVTTSNGRLHQRSLERGGGASVQLRLGDVMSTLPALPSEASAAPERQPDRSEIVGHKGSIFYRAHSYHTKVPPEGIARLIEHYTDPGDWVLDPFCGSGMTGVACLTTGRQGLLSDLSPAAVHIASNYVTPVDPAAFGSAAAQVIERLASLERSLYGTTCGDCNGDARIEYTVWSDVFSCPACSADVIFWESALDSVTGNVGKEVRCDACSSSWVKRDLRWKASVPVLQSVACPQCRKRWQEPLTDDGKARALAFDQSQIPLWYPTVPFESSREMWRGQHRDQEILTAADFYTPRNLWGLAALWHEFDQVADTRMHDALAFLFTAIVNRASRRYQWNPKRPTNVLSSTMYVASLSYEFNVFSLLRRKVTAITHLFKATAELPGRAEVRQSPAQTLSHVPDRSVSYVFTDPPFGSNIFYGDSSFLWEAWLGEITDTTREAVINRSVRAADSGKTVHDYEKLMTEAFEEAARALRRNGWMSVMFHNSSDQVWSALERSIESAGFEVGAAVAFDKRQPSFKAIKGQLAGERVPSFDLVLHLRKAGGSVARRREISEVAPDANEIVAGRLRQHVAEAPPSRRSTPYLHSFAMRVLLEEGLPLQGFTYQAIEELCGEMFDWDGTAWVPAVVEDPTT